MDFSDPVVELGISDLSETTYVKQAAKSTTGLLFLMAQINLKRVNLTYSKFCYLFKESGVPFYF